MSTLAEIQGRLASIAQHDAEDRTVDAVLCTGNDETDLALRALWDLSHSLAEAFSPQWEALFRERKYLGLVPLERGRSYAAGELTLEWIDAENPNYNEGYWCVAEPMRARMRSQITQVRGLATSHNLDSAPLSRLSRYIAGTGILGDEDKLNILDLVDELIHLHQSTVEPFVVSVDGDQSTVYWDKIRHPILYECATLLQELCNAYPNRVGLTKPGKRPNPRTVIGKLPETIKLLIDPNNAGTRLNFGDRHVEPTVVVPLRSTQKRK